MVLDGFTDISVLLGSGCYALCYHGDVRYIGQSRKLISRIYTHRSLWERKRKGKRLPMSGPASEVKVIQFDEVQVFPCKLTELNRLEKELIERYSPKQNTNHVLKPKLDITPIMEGVLAKWRVGGEHQKLVALLPSGNLLRRM